jgi:hypothetical protein
MIGAPTFNQTSRESAKKMGDNTRRPITVRHRSNTLLEIDKGRMTWLGSIREFYQKLLVIHNKRNYTEVMAFVSEKNKTKQIWV